MEVFERQLPANRVESPATLSASVRLFCQNNGYEIESLELRSDVYYIRLRRPRQDAVSKRTSWSFLDNSIIDKWMRRTIIRQAPLIDLPALHPRARSLPRNVVSHRHARNKVDAVRREAEMQRSSI